MSSREESSVYSPEVVDFVTVADQVCRYIEHSQRFEKYEYIGVMRKLFSLIYIKALNLPSFHPVFDEAGDRFVQEADWIRIDSELSVKFDTDNRFEEPYHDMSRSAGELESVTLSEYMADIYQDIKDFCLQYQTGTEEIMNDALWECGNTFHSGWGARVVSCLKAFHTIVAARESRE